MWEIFAMELSNLLFSWVKLSYANFTLSTILWWVLCILMCAYMYRYQFVCKHVFICRFVYIIHTSTRTYVYVYLLMCSMSQLLKLFWLITLQLFSVFHFNTNFFFIIYMQQQHTVVILQKQKKNKKKQKNNWYICK